MWKAGVEKEVNFSKKKGWKKKDRLKKKKEEMKQ